MGSLRPRRLRDLGAALGTRFMEAREGIEVTGYISGSKYDQDRLIAPRGGSRRHLSLGENFVPLRVDPQTLILAGKHHS